MRRGSVETIEAAPGKNRVTPSNLSMHRSLAGVVFGWPSSGLVKSPHTPGWSDTPQNPKAVRRLLAAAAPARSGTLATSSAAFRRL
jgi:hypothetical protein